MRRLAATVALAVAVATLALVGAGAGDDAGTSYLVDAEFRNAFSVIPGEDVKVAGVKVGSIKDLDVTSRQTASVLLEITEPGFGDWRADAECSIRPQSLIGEKFVECKPTQPRAAGAAAPPLLKTADRDGEEVAILGVERTSRPVDLDLVNNIMRRPYRERLTILLNEFGAGIAGRGQDLSKIIRTADPSLRATDQVLKIIADQNEVLARLAQDSDASLAPLTRERDRLASSITQSRLVAEATAERSGDLERNIQKLPTFFRELRPTMERLGALSDEGAPLLADLSAVGPDLTRLIAEIGPFSAAATPALTSLGDASVVGRRALIKSRPIVSDLADFAGSSKTLNTDLRKLTESFRDTGGIERLMDLAYFQTAAINGFDRQGHYLRATLLVDLCTEYVAEIGFECTANFIPEEEPSAEISAAARGGEAPRKVSADPRRVAPLKLLTPETTDVSVDARAAASAARTPAAAPTPPEAATAARGAGTAAPDAGVTSLMDYLLGGDA